MIQKFVDRFIAAKETLRAEFAEAHPESYGDIVRAVIGVLHDEDEYQSPDPERIHGIDDGDYQGTQVFVIGAAGYQPSTYWYSFVSYGSCSHCDTLQRIRYDDGDYSDKPTPGQIDQYYALALHIVQSLKEMT